MSARDPARQRQRCRTLILAAALGVLLATFSLVDRAWPGVVAGFAGTVVVIVLYRRECWDESESRSGTPPARS